LVATVLELIDGANQPGVTVSAEQIGARPPGEIPANHPLVRVACEVLEEMGITPATGIGSTDANVPLSKGYPAICVGITLGSGAHTSAETIFTRPIERGLEQLLRLIPRIWSLS
jgi:di/tripeptidase